MSRDTNLYNMCDYMVAETDNIQSGIETDRKDESGRKKKKPRDSKKAKKASEKSDY